MTTNRQRIQSDIFPYHITARCNNGDWFSVELPVVWSIFLKHLKRLREKYNFKIHHFVLMNNHYHMIVSAPDLNLSHGMCSFQRDISRELNSIAQKKDHLFGKRYYSTIVDSYYYYLIVLKYLYRNPVKSGATCSTQDYVYSSIYSLDFYSQSKIFEYSNYDMEMSLFDKREAFLKWMNEPFDKELDQLISLGLKRRKFKLRKHYQEALTKRILS